MEKTEALARSREVVSAARAIQLARLASHESEGRQVFREAGEEAARSLYQELPYSLKFLNYNLPRPLRRRLALSVAARLAHRFAGGRARLLTHRRHGRLYAAVVDGLFSDRIDSLAGACEFYGAFLEAMLRQLGRVECRVYEVRRPRVRLHECCFEVAWKA